MNVKTWYETHKKETLYGVGGFILALLLIAIFFYTPRPTLVNPPSKTKDATVNVQGKAAPHMGIAVFDKDGNAIVIVSTNEKGEFSVNNLQIGEGKNVYSLRAVASFWRVSLPVTMTIEKDTTAPELKVNNLEGSTVTGSNTVLSGNAEPGSTVTVNGVVASVNPDGTWTATVALQPGSNAVTVTATDPAGNATTETQTVQYAPASQNSPTGTATVTSSTTSVSPGSLPAATGTATGTVSGTSATSTAAATGGSATPTVTQTAATTQSPSPAPAPQPILNIVSTAWVSNQSPNSRANETVYATVKDNYGHPITNASVIAAVGYKSGVQYYSLSSLGNGTYSVSFKLNDKYTSGYRVDVGVTAKYSGFTSSAGTSFTPL